MGEYLNKEGLTRFKEKLLTEVDERIGASGGGTVTSVDGKTGAVDLSDTYQPKGDYLTSAPVTSVNGSTGAVKINDYVTSITISGKTVTITKKDGTSTTQTTQDTTYTLPTASSNTLGGVKTGSNITNSSGTISLTKGNVTSALGYTPLQTAPVTSVNGKTGAITIEATSNEEILEAANRVTDIEVSPEVATVERLQTSVARVESNLNSIDVGVTSVNGLTGAVTGFVRSVNGTTADANGNVTISLQSHQAYVTETWKSGSSWYRKWSDGFVEQGFVSPNVTTTSGSGGFTISLITPMPSNNYILVAVPLDSDTSISAGLMVKSKTTTSCNVGAYANHSPFMVYVAGY